MRLQDVVEAHQAAAVRMDLDHTSLEVEDRTDLAGSQNRVHREDHQVQVESRLSHVRASEEVDMQSLVRMVVEADRKAVEVVARACQPGAEDEWTTSAFHD